MPLALDLTEADWDSNMAVNAKGVFLTNQAAVRGWLKTKSPGVIVNTASLAGKIGAPLLAHYSASKFAVVGFTQALAREVAKDGIRVNCVCPGGINTRVSHILGRNDEEGFSYVYKQPESKDELYRMVEAVMCADLACIRYRGNDARLLRYLRMKGCSAQCDP